MKELKNWDDASYNCHKIAFRVTTAYSEQENVLLWLGNTATASFLFKICCNISRGPVLQKTSLWLNGITGWYST